MKRKSLRQSICPVTRSLDQIGDWWSLLIIRTALVGGRRFSDFRLNLGISPNMLSARLKMLIHDGIMELVPSTDGGPHPEYLLTEKGRALRPVIVELAQWGQRFLFEPDEACTSLVDAYHGAQRERMRGSQ